MGVIRRENFRVEDRLEGALIPPYWHGEHAFRIALGAAVATGSACGAGLEEEARIEADGNARAASQTSDHRGITRGSRHVEARRGDSLAATEAGDGRTAALLPSRQGTLRTEPHGLHRDGQSPAPDPGREKRRCAAAGLQGLGIRVARAINRLFDRTGKVFRERFFARALKSRRAVYYAVRYALQNARKHGVSIPEGEWDRYSSGRFIRDAGGTPVAERPVVLADYFLWPWLACALNLVQPSDLPGPRIHA